MVDQQGITLLLENIDLEEDPHYYLWSAAEGFEIVRQVNHPRVKFLYDCYHEQISEGSLIGKIEKNLQHVGIVHVADGFTFRTLNCAGEAPPQPGCGPPARSR